MLFYSYNQSSNPKPKRQGTVQSMSNIEGAIHWHQGLLIHGGWVPFQVPDLRS